MATKIKLGNGNWGVKENGLLAYNDEDNIFKAIEMDFSRSSTATRESSAGLIADSPLNTPRIDFTDGGALLLEPSRTNLITNSNQFESSNWTKQAGITITDNTTEVLSPEGKYNSAKIVSTDATKGFFDNTGSSTANSVRSIYLRGAVGGENVLLKDISGFGGISSITLTDNWVRYELATSNTGDTYRGLFVDNISVGTIYAYGAQWEEGSYATSYIPTSGATATRIAETCSKSGLENYINSSEGVLYFEVSTKDTSVVPVITISDGTITNVIEFAFFGTNQYNIIHRSSLGNTTYVSSVVDAETFNKFAFAYNNSTLKTYLNGVNVDSRAVSGALNGLDALKLSFVNNTLPFYGKIKDLRVYDTALSDSELQALTS